uniref:Serpin domain-containing protein n=1 Tax=Glossina brevipalpis TaxID=37001 RepID=A0A1A9WMR8_9MUSC
MKSFGNWRKESIRLLYTTVLLLLNSSLLIDQSQANNLDHNLGDFAIKTYHELNDYSRMFIFSPFLLQMTGAVIHLGTSGKAAAEIDKCFDLDPTYKTDEIADYFYQRLLRIKTSKFVKFVNRVYIEYDYEVKESFSNLLKKKFLLDIETVDFSKHQETLAKINQFAASITDNVMQNAVYDDEFREFDKLVTLNVLYFKGKWKIEFPPEKNSIKDFNVTPNQTVPIEVMNVKAEFNYVSLPQLDISVLELPYDGGDKSWSMSMLVFLPKENITLTDIKTKLDKICFKDVLESMSSTVVNVQLPKFSAKERGDFTFHLEELGLNHTLESSNDFDKMLKTPKDLNLAAMATEFVLDVNEDGANRAAEVSGAAEEFIADRPFMYAIICKGTVLDEPFPLIIGRYTPLLVKYFT